MRFSVNIPCLFGKKPLQEALSTMKELNRAEGITVLLITHYMEEAALADRILVMQRGRLMMDGSPRAVFAQADRLKELGLSVPQVTELADALRAEGLELEAGISDEDELAEKIALLYRQKKEALA